MALETDRAYFHKLLARGVSVLAITNKGVMFAHIVSGVSRY